MIFKFRIIYVFVFIFQCHVAQLAIPRSLTLHIIYFSRQPISGLTVLWLMPPLPSLAVCLKNCTLNRKWPFMIILSQNCSSIYFALIPQWWGATCHELLHKYWNTPVLILFSFIKKLKLYSPLYCLKTLKKHIIFFSNSECAVKHTFNSNHITLPIPVPMGGKSSEDLHIPHTLTTPLLAVPLIGLVIPSTEFSIPSFSIPPAYELSLPLLGIAEVSAKVNSNFYNWEASVSVDAPARTTHYKSAGDCPLEILSYTIEGKHFLVLSFSLFFGSRHCDGSVS